jgi:hypothetical protein
VQRGHMMVSPDGYLVEQIAVQKDVRRSPKLMLRVRRGSYLVADCATVAAAISSRRTRCHRGPA